MHVGLPDDKGRRQIINIHTKRMRENDLLDDDVDFDLLTQRTKNFSGAGRSRCVRVTFLPLSAVLRRVQAWGHVRRVEESAGVGSCPPC